MVVPRLFKFSLSRIKINELEHFFQLISVVHMSVHYGCHVKVVESKLLVRFRITRLIATSFNVVRLAADSALAVSELECL